MSRYYQAAILIFAMNSVSGQAGAQTAASPPSDQLVLDMLPKLPPWLTRSNMTIERELIVLPAQWRMTVFYREDFKLWWLVLPGEYKVRWVYIDQENIS